MRKNKRGALPGVVAGLVAAVAPIGFSNAEDKAAAQVELKPTPGGRFIYLEADGPYWEAGATIAKIQDLMTAHQQTGPINVRYSGDPSADSGGARKAKIGFIAAGAFVIEAPFREQEVEPVAAAGMVIEGFQGATVQSIPTIKNWIQSQGLEPSGLVVELINGLGDAKKPAKSEMFIAVRQPRNQAKPTESPDTKSEAPAKPTLPGSVIDELWDKKDYKGIAERLIPEQPAPNKETQIWLGQLVHRVGAVSKGVLMMYPDQAAETTVLTDALVDRLTKVAPDAMSESKKQSIVRTDYRPDSLEGRRSRLVRELDMLLSKVSSRSRTPGEVSADLRRILDQVQVLISETAP